MFIKEEKQDKKKVGNSSLKKPEWFMETNTTTQKLYMKITRKRFVSFVRNMVIFGYLLTNIYLEGDAKSAVLKNEIKIFR